MYRQTTLANGVRIVTEAADSRVASVGVWVEVGARDEHDLNNGAAHFIEHMLFKGTARRDAQQIARELDVMGGMANAFTSTESTCLYATVLADQLPRLADLFSDMVLSSRFDPDEVEHEREVILQEIAMVEDTPDDQIHDLFNRQLWGRHPLGNTVLGSREVIAALSARHLNDYVRKHYRPERMLIAGAGRIDHDRFCALWHDAFSAADSGGKKGADQRRTPEAQAPSRKIFPKPLEQAHLVLGTYGLSETSPQRHALHVLNVILGGNMSSRLFQEIREKRGLAYSVFSFLNCHSDSGSLAIYLGVDPASADEALELVSLEIDRLCREQVANPVLNEARDYAQAVVLLAEENMEARMTRLARNEINFNRHVPVEELIDSIGQVTPAQVREVAEMIFAQPLTGVALGPLGPEALNWKSLDRR